MSTTARSGDGDDSATLRRRRRRRRRRRPTSLLLPWLLFAGSASRCAEAHRRRGRGEQRSGPDDEEEVDGEARRFKNRLGELLGSVLEGSGKDPPSVVDDDAPVARALSYREFSAVLSSELDRLFDEEDDEEEETGRRGRGARRRRRRRRGRGAAEAAAAAPSAAAASTEELWTRLVASEWERADRSERSASSALPGVRSDDRGAGDWPFLLCHDDDGSASATPPSTRRRRELLREAAARGGLRVDDAALVAASGERACAYAAGPSSAARRARGLAASPLPPPAKLRAGTLGPPTGGADPTRTVVFHVELCPDPTRDAAAASRTGRDALRRAARATTGPRDDENEEKGRRRLWEEAYAVLGRRRLSDERARSCGEVLETAVVHTETIGTTEPHRHTLSYSLRLEDDEDDDDDSACLDALATGLAEHPEVCSVERRPVFKLLNHRTQWVLQSAVPEHRPFFDRGLGGAGQIIQISDSGLDADNCYFSDRSVPLRRDGTVHPAHRKVVQYHSSSGDDAATYRDHGTHVAATAAGRRADGAAGRADGVARDARLAFYDVGRGRSCCHVPGVARMVGPGRRAGAFAHSASWGTDFSGYDHISADADRTSLDDDGVLVVVAVGNRGDARGTVGSPATAKNVLSVGATAAVDASGSVGGVERVARYSSRGPTDDGRVAPQLLAPGTDVLSAAAVPDRAGACDPRRRPRPDRATPSSSGVHFMTGTSMACPAAAGAAAVVRQYLAEGWWPSGRQGSGPSLPTPSGALLRALLINGGEPLAGLDAGDGRVDPNTAPYDHHQGFGRINLSRSLPLEGENDVTGYLVDRRSIRDGDADSYEFIVADCSSSSFSEFSVTLVWTDPPGRPGCRRCLVNDLDLRVTKRSRRRTTSHFPNGLTRRDDVNTVERVRLPTRRGDRITVEVRATNLATSSQTYALAAVGCWTRRDGDGGDPPTDVPTDAPTRRPTPSPTRAPTRRPTRAPTRRPTPVRRADADCGAEGSGTALVELSVLTDSYASESSWTLSAADDDDDVPPLASRAVLEANARNDDAVCLPTGRCYVFALSDAYGDGICCRFGKGEYEGRRRRRDDATELLFSGDGDFEDRAEERFCLTDDDDDDDDEEGNEGRDADPADDDVVGCADDWSSLRAAAANAAAGDVVRLCPDVEIVSDGTPLVLGTNDVVLACDDDDDDAPTGGAATTLGTSDDDVDYDEDDALVGVVDLAGGRRRGRNGGPEPRCVVSGPGPHLVLAATGLVVRGVLARRSDAGGVLVNRDGAEALFEDCAFKRNTNDDAAAVANLGPKGTVVFRRCHFWYNDGATGVINAVDTDVVLERCIFKKNTSSSTTSGTVVTSHRGRLDLDRSCLIANAGEGPGTISIRSPTMRGRLDNLFTAFGKGDVNDCFVVFYPRGSGGGGGGGGDDQGFCVGSGSRSCRARE